MPANIHMVTVQHKEWASHGFIIFSVDHKEEINLKYHSFAAYQDYINERHAQGEARKHTLTKVFDFVYNSPNIKDLFEDQEVILDYKIFS